MQGGYTMDQELCMRIADIRRRLDTAALERWGRVPEIIAVSKTIAAPPCQRDKSVRDSASG